jgi:DNA-binding NarL/FixJ family response regulator
MQLISVSIIEDIPDYRKAFQLMVNGTDGLNCKDTYSNGEDAVAGLPKARPDIVLVDINLPGISGIEVIRQVKRECPNMQFLVLTVYEDDEKIFEALTAGASGYLLKSTQPARIIEAIRDLYDGGSPMSAQIARKVVRSFQQPAGKMNNPYEELLTEREKEVLQLLAKGKLYKQIADELHISVQTIKSHCHHLYEKLHVTTKVDAINKYFSR